MLAVVLVVLLLLIVLSLIRLGVETTTALADGLQVGLITAVVGAVLALVVLFVQYADTEWRDRLVWPASGAILGLIAGTWVTLGVGHFRIPPEPPVPNELWCGDWEFNYADDLWQCELYRGPRSFPMYHRCRWEEDDLDLDRWACARQSRYWPTIGEDPQVYLDESGTAYWS